MGIILYLHCPAPPPFFIQPKSSHFRRFNPLLHRHPNALCHSHFFHFICACLAAHLFVGYALILNVKRSGGIPVSFYRRFLGTSGRSRRWCGRDCDRRSSLKVVAVNHRKCTTLLLNSESGRASPYLVLSLATVRQTDRFQDTSKY